MRLRPQPASQSTHRERCGTVAPMASSLRALQLKKEFLSQGNDERSAAFRAASLPSVIPDEVAEFHSSRMFGLGPLVDVLGEDVPGNEFGGPFGVELRRRLCRDHLFQRLARILERSHTLVDRYQHIAKICQLRLVAD